MNKKANAVSNIHFRTEAGPETANCSETTPDLGKVAITAKGSYPITLGRENGYQVWIVGKVDKTAYHGVAEIPAKFKIKARQQDR